MELQSLLGVCNQFYCFLSDFSHAARTLNKELYTNDPTQSQVLPALEKEAVVELKFLLMNPPGLALPQSDGHLTIDTGA